MEMPHAPTLVPAPIGRDPVPPESNLGWLLAQASHALATELTAALGKFAVCCRHAGRLRFRTVGSDLGEARRQRAALIAAVRRGVVPVSPRLRFDTLAGWWLARFEARVAAGERHPRTLEAHRY